MNILNIFPKKKSLSADTTQLFELVKKLQLEYSFFFTKYDFEPEDPKRLYGGLIQLIENSSIKRGYVYMCGNLGVRDLNSEKELINFLKEKINSCKSMNSSMVELCFRCYIWIMREEKVNLDEHKLQLIMENVKPFSYKYSKY